MNLTQAYRSIPGVMRIQNWFRARRESLIMKKHPKLKVGDIVFPTIGPHKNKEHKIIYCLDNGTYNIQPLSIPASKIAYKLGAVNTSITFLKTK